MLIFDTSTSNTSTVNGLVRIDLNYVSESEREQVYGSVVSV